MILLIKSSIVILCLLAFYKLLLEKESFFKANRIYLLTSLLLACLLPFIVLPKISQNQGIISEKLDGLIVSQELTEQGTVMQLDAGNSAVKVESPHLTGNKNQSDHTISNNKPASESISVGGPENSNAFNLLNWIFWIYLFGIIILSINLIAQVLSTIWKVLRSEDKIIDDGYTIVNSTKDIEPCSFFKYIFINPSSYDYETYEQIIRHEKIHVNQRHSLDLLLAEVALIVFWFNPFVWLLRREVEKNIEYQTDDILVNGNAEPKEGYQLNLVKIACRTKPLAITTNYNQSLIKQRILKMNTKRSNKFNYWKYSFSLPLLFVLILFLNRPIESISQPVDAIVEMLENPFVDELNSDSLESKDKENDSRESEKTKIKPSVEKSQFIADCTEFEKAVASGDLQKVKEILKNLDPDCLKIKKNDRSNLKSVENLLQNKKKSLSENPALVDSEKITSKNGALDKESVCESIELAIDEKDYKRLRKILTYEDISCLNDIYGEPSQDIKLLQGLLFRGAELNVDENDVIEVSDIGMQIDTQWPEDFVCSDPQFLKLMKAIKSKDEDRVVHILAHSDFDCPFDDKTSSDMIFIKELMKYHPEIINRNGRSIIIFGIGLKIDLDIIIDRGAESISSKSETTTTTDEAEMVSEIEKLLEPLQKYSNELSCAELVDAVIDNDYKLTKLLLEHINPNCFHRETHTQTADGESFTTTKVTTPLIAAARDGNISLTELLLHTSADENFRVDEDESPLIAAVKAGNLQVVKLLVKANAEKNTKDRSDMTALDYAIIDNNKSLIKYLKSIGAKSSIEE